MVESGTGGSTAAAKYLTGGTWTIPAGLTSVNVAHGLGYVPSKYTQSPTNTIGVDAYISAVDATNLTISIEFAQPNDATGAWMAG